MEKLTKKKTKKKKLGALVILLLLTVVMLTVSTYAWFTSNKTVTVSTLDVHVDAKSGLQVSADGFEWKTVLSNADIAGASAGRYSTAVNQLPSSLEPTSTAGRVNGANGHLYMFNGVTGEDEDGTGDYTLSATAATDANGTIGNYIVFDLFLKTEAPGMIYLTSDSTVVPKSGSSDRGLKNAARTAFVVQGTVPSDSELETIQALKTNSNDDVYVWEPNYDVHTTYGVTAALEYGINTTVGPDAARLSYDGVVAATASPIKLKNATAALNPSVFSTVTPKITTKETETTYKEAFNLTPGVTKIRVYMWIEGQDVDCENNASGTDISFNVQLSTNPTP